MLVRKQPDELVTVAPPAPPLAGASLVAIVARSGGGGEALFVDSVVGADGSLRVQVGAGADGETYRVSIDGFGGPDRGDAVTRIDLDVQVIDPDWTMPDGGVAYLTIAEFVDRVGLDEAVAMTDRAGAGRIDRGYLVAALRDAQALVDLNLAARYAVPIAIVPDAIKTAIADLARARLYPRGAPDGVSDAAKAATALLARIAGGALPLPLPAGQTAASADSVAPVLFTPGTRQYPDGLADY